VRAQRTQLESQFQHTRECFERGLSYDAALQTSAENGVPLNFQRLVVLSSYCEFTGKRPETLDPLSQNHMTILQGIANEAKLLGSKREQRQKSVIKQEASIKPEDLPSRRSPSSS
jgi:hypothetical protein